MSNHLQEVADYVMSDDTSELAKVKAELAYALMSLEREIAIAQSEQARSAALTGMLTDAALQLEYMQERMPTGTGATVLARINHVLTDLIAPRD